LTTYIVRAKSTLDAINQIIMTYGGPIILIILGYFLTLINKITSKFKNEIDKS